MAGNVLTGKIQITAPGVAQTMNGVSVAVNKTSTALKQLPTASNAATLSLTNLGRVVQDAPFGFLGIANNLNPLLESFQRLKATTGSTGGALKALGKDLMGAGGLGFALSVASSLLIVFGDRLFGATKQAQAAKTAADELKDSISGAFKEVAKEATEVGSLVTILKSETETRERRLSAIKELQRIQPDIFKGLKLEGDAVIGLDAAYTAYIANLKNVIAAKITQLRIEQKIETLLRSQGAALTGNEKALVEGVKNFQKSLQGKENIFGGRAFTDVLGNKERTEKALEADIKSLFDDLSKFTSGLKLTPVKADKVKIDKDFIPKFPDLLPVKLRIVPTFDDDAFKKAALGIKTLTFAEALQKKFSDDIAKLVVAPRFQLSTEALANQANQAKMTAAAETLAASFEAALQTSLNDGISSIGEGLGNILAGNNFGDQFAQVFSSLFTTIGKALIKFGIVKEGLDKILGPGGITIPGGIAIGLGIFAIAAGQLLKGVSGKRADGGPVVGGKSYLVGERGPEIFTPNTGGGITANHQFGGRGGGVAGSFGGNVIFKIAGKELIGVLSLAQQSQNRLT